MLQSKNAWASRCPPAAVLAFDVSAKGGFAKAGVIQNRLQAAVLAIFWPVIQRQIRRLIKDIETSFLHFN
jgi:hypothetical protein